MSIKKTVEINAKFLSKCECTMYDPVYSTHFKFITRQQSSTLKATRRTMSISQNKTMNISLFALPPQLPVL